MTTSQLLTDMEKFDEMIVDVITYLIRKQSVPIAKASMKNFR